MGKWKIRVVFFKLNYNRDLITYNSITSPDINRKISENFEFRDEEDNVSENGKFETLNKDKNNETKNIPVHDITDHSSLVLDQKHQHRNPSNYQEYYNNIPVRDFSITRLIALVAIILNS